MPATAFITNAQAHTLKKRLEELIQHSHVGRDAFKAYQSAWEETMSATEEIVRVEKEIDERVKTLYGV